MKNLKFDKVFEKMDQAFSKMGEAFDTLGCAFESFEYEDTLDTDGIVVKVSKGKVQITGEVKSLTINGKKVEYDKSKKE